MKSILYAGAVLMAGACIYGFTDYRNTSRNEAFKEMYTEEKVQKAVPAVATEVEQSDVVPVKEVTLSKMKSGSRKKEVRSEEELKSIRPLDDSERMDAAETKIGKEEVTITPPEKMSIKKKKKRVNSKMFSRAPIREEQEEVILVPGKQKDVKAAGVSKEL